MTEQSTQIERSKIYLKGINGIRIIFIVPVVLSHIIMELGEFGLNPFILGKTSEGQSRVLDIGLYGLAIIFGISGFLIPYLLGLEKNKRGKVNIKKFYVRRALRIFPIYYANVLFCLLLYQVFDIDFAIFNLTIIVIYVVNIPYVFGGELPLLAHYWTLAVEEQFYLVWPWLHKFSNKQIRRACWLLLILFIIVRELLIINSPELVLLKLMNHVWFQCILIGAIFALYYLDYRALTIKVAENEWLQYACWILLILGAFNVLSGNIPLDIELTTIAGCLIVVNQNSRKVVVSLENRLFNYLGRLTYGIYIVHYPLIFLCSRLVNWEHVSNRSFRYVLVVLTVFGISILVAHLAHKFLERPFLKLKEKKFTYVHGMKA